MFTNSPCSSAVIPRRWMWVAASGQPAWPRPCGLGQPWCGVRCEGGAGREICGRPRRTSAAEVRAVGVELDLLLAHRVADLLLLGDGLLVQADALHRHGLLGDDGLLGVEHDLVLLLADRGSVHGVADVGVGDRLALDTGLLAGDRHRL